MADDLEWRPQPKAPTPQQYLRAGLPFHPLVRGEYLFGPEEDGSRLPRWAADVDMSATRVNDEGDPVRTVIWPAPNRYLTRPPRQRWWREDVESIERQSSGILRSAQPAGHRSSPRPEHPDRDPLPTDRAVTFDLSVLQEGLAPEKFRSDDVLFVSTALLIEIVVHVGVAHDGRRWTDFGRWRWSEPVQVNWNVLELCVALAGGSRMWREPQLTQSDLLCAATAVLYKAPIYTMRPELYQGLEKPVRTIQYGPIRNKDAVPKAAQ